MILHILITFVTQIFNIYDYDTTDKTIADTFPQ